MRDDLDLDIPDLWVAHERPERPFERGMWLCDCGACLLALRAEVVVRPRTPLVLKTNFDRIIVTAELLLEALETTGEAESLCYVSDDWVRETFVAEPPGLLPPARWWSMTCREDEHLLGRRVVVRRRPARQSRAAAERRVAAHRADPNWYLRARERHW